MLVDGYTRVSQVRGRSGPSFISPALQRERIEAWAKLQGATVGEMFEELDESGARNDRPLLVEALRRVEAGESHGIVVAKLDRFGRSLVDSLAVIDRIRAAGGVFVSVGDGLDLTTDTGKLVLRIMLSMAEWELDRIRSQWDAARERAVARGVHLGSRRPSGYARGGDGRLRPHPSEAEMITELFGRRAKGTSVRQLCRWLDSLGLPTVTGNRHWTDSTVSHILENRVYLGESRSGAFVNESAHEPLVDPATWQRAQRPRVIRPTKARHTPTLLSGLLRCAGCSLSMGTHFSRRAGRKTRVYSCLGRSAAGPCPSRSYVSASIVEPYVEEVAFALARRRERLRPDRRALERLELQLAEAKATLASYRDEPRFQRTLGDERYAAGLTVRRERIDRLFAGIGAERARTGAWVEHVHIEDGWVDMSMDDRRESLGELIDCVFVMRGDREPDERLFVCARGEGPLELPARGGRGRGARPFDPSECRRTRPAAAVSPRRPASWSGSRIRAELSAFLERGGAHDLAAG
ncbi:MAG: recombinase family protein [Solirubrobacteraceae bacterium]